VSPSCPSSLNTKSLPAEFSLAYFRGQPPIGGWPELFAVVTGHNPEGVVDEPLANDTADLSLRQEIERAGLIHFRVTGGSLDGLHQEPGWGIVLQNPEKAQQLSEQFRQLAFFWVEQGQLALIDTYTAETFQQGEWKDRWLGVRSTPRPPTFFRFDPGRAAGRHCAALDCTG
jgi:hypothetical protein